MSNKMMGPRPGGPGGRMATFEKPKNFKETIYKLFSYCKSWFPVIIISLVLAIVATILSTLGPDKIKDITNTITNGITSPNGIDIKEVTTIGYILIAMYVSSGLLSYIVSFLMATSTQNISKRMRGDIASKINRLPLSYFDKATTGDVLSRVTNDVDTIGQTMNHSVTTLVSAITSFLGAGIMMFITSWQLALTAIASSLLGFVIISITMKFSQNQFKEQQNKLGAIGGHIEEIYSGHNVVKAYNADESAKTKFENINNALYASAWKSQFISGLMMPLMTFISNLGYVAVCVIGAVLTMNGVISFGVIIAFMMYIRLFTQPLTQIAQGMQNLQTTVAASERVFEFLNEKELANENAKFQKFENIRGDVEFKHVKFGYIEGHTIINDFSAKISSGQKVAIVGPTGAGKTTLVNLLMRFYEVEDGEILVDGINIKDVTRSELHNQFGMVLQDTWLFEGTIRENIVYSKENVKDADVRAACKAVGLWHYIKTLPEGLNTILNEKANLSNGQRQLVTIARTMIKNNPMLILDEATSSVDTRTEIIIQKAMDKLLSGRTSFIIAHRLSTIKNADLILVMRDGDIVESGKHEELLSHNNFYSELYNSQFSFSSEQGGQSVI
ncbi:MAG: ABC transporter ATP-binding protein/permease [Christensenellaceae bacterium]|jgi:ATP-binding cassette subfamily B protein|nr:ABC transporter ATP-binding protein/permease [Christensenellaceae bacterium]